MSQILLIHGAYQGGWIWGPTARLEVQYRRPTPVGHELRFDAVLGEREGRKQHARVTLHDGDTCLAEAEAIFVVTAGRDG